MFEISESSYKHVSQCSTTLGQSTYPRIVLDSLLGAVATNLISPSDDIVSIYHRRLEHGYPTPSLSRDSVLDDALPELRKYNIWSRGRFGSYKYEIANQDHSLMLGVEAVDNILFGCHEVTLDHPNIVNQKKNTQLRYRNSPKLEY